MEPLASPELVRLVETLNEVGLMLLATILLVPVAGLLITFLGRPFTARNRGK